MTTEIIRDFCRISGVSAFSIAYLCNSGAAMITGHNLVIDGGLTIK